jgi:hypothetical protein
MNCLRLVGLAVLLLGLGAIGGCASQRTQYDWGNYNQSLYSYYKHPEKAAELMLSIQKIVDSAARGRRPVPPGLFAELGYLQLQQGHVQEAVFAFQAEEVHWPESKVFMDRMIRVASTGQRSESVTEVTTP